MKLELTDKEKEIASRAARVAGAQHTDDFWANVQKEVSRLEQKPTIKPREVTGRGRLL
jgi:hypothetical protein